MCRRHGLRELQFRRAATASAHILGTAARFPSALAAEFTVCSFSDAEAGLTAPTIATLTFGANVRFQANLHEDGEFLRRI